MAHACSGAGHQYGGSGQYKSHHGRPTRVSMVSQMSQMSDVQLQEYAERETMQEIQEEEEKVVNNTSWLRHMSWNNKEINEAEFEESPSKKILDQKKRCEMPVTVFEMPNCQW